MSKPKESPEQDERSAPEPAYQGRMNVEGVDADRPPFAATGGLLYGFGFAAPQPWYLIAGTETIVNCGYWWIAPWRRVQVFGEVDAAKLPPVGWDNSDGRDCVIG